MVSDKLACGWNYPGNFPGRTEENHETQNYVQAQRNIHTVRLRRETSYL